MGWYDKKDRATGTPVTGQDGKVPSNYDKEGTITLYAQWDIKCHILPIEEAGSIVSSSNYYVLGDSTLDTITFTASPSANFEFKNWQIISDTTVEITDNPMTYKYTKDAEISAVFEREEITITFNTNNPEGVSTETQKSIRYAETITVDPPVNYPGYRFSGWFTASSDGIRMSNKLGEIKVSASVFYSYTTLYAQWQESEVATDFEYVLMGTAPNSYYKITGYTGASSDLYIPYYLKGIPVKEIGEEFIASSYGASKVIIPCTIETISSASFAGYTGNIYFDRGFSTLSIIDSPIFSESHNIYVHGMYIKEANIYSNGTYKNSFDLGVKSQYIDDVYYNFFGHYVDSSIDTKEELQALVDYSYVYTVNNPFACKITYLTSPTEAVLKAEIQSTFPGVSGYRHNTASSFLYSLFDGENVIRIKEFTAKQSENRIASTSTASPNVTKVKSMVSSYVTDESVITRVFPIDYANPFVVYNSEQLLYAVENGYKPVFVNHSDPIIQAEINAAKNIYEKARNALMQNIPESADDVKKITIIHDWIIDNNMYDSNLLELGNIAPSQELVKYKGFYLDGVFIDGHAVCDGISKAFSLMTNILGIESIRVFGVVIDSGGNHAWNKVRIGDLWYTLDLTADGLFSKISEDNIEITTHRYFLISDVEMGKTNEESSDVKDPFYVPQVSTGSYNYYAVTEYAIGNDLCIQSNTESNTLTSAYESFYNAGTVSGYYGVEYIYKTGVVTEFPAGLYLEGKYDDNYTFRIALNKK